MKIRGLLKCMPAHHRQKLERQPVLVDRINAGLTLEEALESPGYPEVAWQILPESARVAISWIAARFAGVQFSPNQLESVWTFTERSVAEREAAISLLRRRGLLWALSRTAGGSFYVLPEEHLPVWQRQLSTPVISGWLLQENELSEVKSPGPRASRQLFSLLAGIARGGLKLTRGGTLSKRDAGKLAQGQPAAPEAMRAAQVRISPGTGHPIPSVLLEFAFRLKLLVKADQTVRIVKTGRKQWLSRTADDMNTRLYAVWWRMNEPDSAFLHHVRLLMEQCPRGLWVCLSALVTSMRDCGMAVPPDEAESGEAGAEAALEKAAAHVSENWLEPLFMLGWVEIGSSAQGPAFRWLISPVETDSTARTTAAAEDDNLSHETGKWYVQPDFEVLVPKDVPFHMLWELEKFAQLLRTDDVSIYRITGESWRKGLARFHQPHQAIAILDQGAVYGIPANVRLAIEEWGSSAIEPPDIYDGNETDIYPLEPVDDEDGIPGCTVETFIPEADDLLPGWRSVPPSWWKECRVYHLSTRREMIRQAIAWRTALRLRSRGLERTVVPHRLEEQGAQGVLEASEKGNRVKIEAENWEEVQILLPDMPFSWYDRSESSQIGVNRF